jgi:hypothetical protein
LGGVAREISEQVLLGWLILDLGKCSTYSGIRRVLMNHNGSPEIWAVANLPNNTTILGRTVLVFCEGHGPCDYYEK